MTDLNEPRNPDIATPSTRGLIAFVPNDELDRNEHEEAKRQAESEQSTPIILSLAAHVKTAWDRNKEAKEQDIQPRLLKCLRLRKGEYDSSTHADISAQGGTDLFIKLTKTKCRAAKSWMSDILTASDKPFMITPTPVPELPPVVAREVSETIMADYQEAVMVHQQAGMVLDEQAFRQQAERYAKDMLQAVRDRARADDEALEAEINDDLTEGGWYDAVGQILWDITTFPAAFLKGPVVRMQKHLEWSDNGPIAAELPTKQWERVNPFDIYPSPSAKNIQEGDLIERHRLTRQALHDLIGVEGYNEDAIRMVLDEYDKGGLKLWTASDEERQSLENKPHERGQGELIDALQFWGSVQGKLLVEWGMEQELVPEPTDEYDVEAWLIGNTVISAVINDDPLGRRPYYSASYDDNPDSVWGEGVPEIMEDIQQICNSTARAMVNNMGIASGPQVAVISDLLQPGMDVNGMYPWKLWQFVSEQFATGRVPIEFFQPDPIFDPLQRVYDYFFKQASEVTGIPAYIYGSENVGGAARTASGLSMLMNNANKGLRDVIANIDKGIIKPSVKAYWFHMMLYEPEKAKGDINIVARASEYLLMLESLQVRRMEFLDITNNPTDNDIIGLAGRAEVLREVARTLKLPVDRIVPDKDSILDNVHQAKMEVAIQNLSKALGIAPDQIVAMASGQPMQQGQQGYSPTTLNPAGEPM